MLKITVVLEGMEFHLQSLGLQCNEVVVEVVVVTRLLITYQELVAQVVVERVELQQVQQAQQVRPILEVVVEVELGLMVVMAALVL
jgi:hypothetical protein